mgnify:CR=1 FL=1|jgi:hypothetical protein
MNKLTTIFSLLFLSFNMGVESSDTIPATNTTLCKCDIEKYDNMMISVIILSFGALFLSCYSIFFSWRNYRRTGYAVITN